MGFKITFRKKDLMPTTSVDMDVTTILYCPKDNMCLLRADLDKDGHCKRCGGEVQDVTNSPLGQSWRTMVSPKPKRKRLWKDTPSTLLFLLPIFETTPTDGMVIVILVLVGILVAVILGVSFTRKDKS